MRNKLQSHFKNKAQSEHKMSQPTRLKKVIHHLTKRLPLSRLLWFTSAQAAREKKSTLALTVCDFNDEN